MLRRKAYAEILQWKNNHMKKCLMIKGARQVGKTYLVREFGKTIMSHSLKSILLSILT